jgi:signal transduction histidine kinase
MTGAAGEIALRLAAIAASAGGARERDTAIMRLLRERLGATFAACYTCGTRAGKAPGARLRASDSSVTSIYPILTRAARQIAREWLAAGRASQRVLNDLRLGRGQVAGCLPGGGLALVAVWPPDGDATAGLQTLNALEPMLLLTLGRGAGRTPRGQDTTGDAAKSSFVSLVSHALRTPLNTLTGFVEIVLDQPVGPLNERQREFLTYARDSGQALTQLVEDVTLLSRADEGSLALHREQVDAAEIAERALRGIEAAMKARSVQLSLRVERETVTVECDGQRLAHALLKLLENAVKFSPEGAAVTLTVTADGDMLHLAVQDEGLGIAPEDVERIFARFYQAETTAKSHPGGYGLGLAVARMIARAHGGEILVESAPARGATFVLTVPIGALADGDQRVATKIKRGALEAAARPS